MEIDSSGQPVQTHLNGSTRTGYPIAIKTARVEGKEGQVLLVHAASPTDRTLWSQSLRAALLPESLKPIAPSPLYHHGTAGAGGGGGGGGVGSRAAGSGGGGGSVGEQRLRQHEEEAHRELFGR